MNHWALKGERQQAVSAFALRYDRIFVGVSVLFHAAKSSDMPSASGAATVKENEEHMRCAVSPAAWL